MSSVLCLKIWCNNGKTWLSFQVILNTMVCKSVLNWLLYLKFFLFLVLVTVLSCLCSWCISWSLFCSGVEAGYSLRSVWDTDHYTGCYFPEYKEKSRLAYGENACQRLHSLSSGKNCYFQSLLKCPVFTGKEMVMRGYQWEAGKL